MIINADVKVCGQYGKSRNKAVRSRKTLTEQ